MSLSGAGYRCQCLYDGMTACDAIEHETYDLILLDVMLPGLDGFSLMEYIRPREIPVIFLTARTAVSDRVKGTRSPTQSDGTLRVQLRDTFQTSLHVEHADRASTASIPTAPPAGDTVIDLARMR